MPTPAVAAAAGIVTPATVAIVGVVSGGVHGPETRCGQGDEHLRVLGDGGRHVVVSAVQAGVHELPGVAGIQIEQDGHATARRLLQRDST